MRICVIPKASKHQSRQGPIPRARLIGAILLLIMMMLTACQRPGMLPPAPQTERIWPPPPAQARVRYLAEIKGPRDLNAVRRFFGYLAGIPERKW